GQGGCAQRCGDPSCPCPNVPDVVISSAGKTYRIDANEVTNRDYRAWLAQNPSLAGQRAECQDWNDSYIPGEVSKKAVELLGDAAVNRCTNRLGVVGEDLLPVTCIDWCDAAAYCSWAKKRLCGKIGAPADAKTIDVTQGAARLDADPAVSEW